MVGVNETHLPRSTSGALRLTALREAALISELQHVQWHTC
jgi:hypothetical protein